MKFVFYKVASIIRENLKISYSCENFNLKNVSLGTKCLFAALFITPPKSKNGHYEKISGGNIERLIGSIDSISNSNSYMTGARSIPKAMTKEYTNIEELPAELIRFRYHFFTEMIHCDGKIIETCDALEKMIRSASNISEKTKADLLDLEHNDLFYGVLCDENTTGYNTECISIFRILAYSTRYSEVKTCFDDLGSEAKVHSLYIERKDVITALEQSFQAQKIVYLCGIRGCGKTEIVQKFISESNFYGVMTLFFETDLDEALAKENFFNLKLFSIEESKKVFREMDEHYLLVIEGVSSKLDNNWREFIKQCGCKVLVVSSWKPNEDGNAIVTVSKLSEPQAISMMDNYLKTEGRLTTEQKLKIVKKLNYHAFAVTVYARAIEQSCLEYDEIIAILNKSLVSDEIEEKVTYKEDDEAKLASQHIRDLFEETFENLHSDGVENVLRVMSLMPDSGISLKDLQRYTGLKNNNAINNILKRLFWLEVTTNSERIVTIHSIVRDIVREMLKPDINNCNTLVECVYNGISQYWGYSEEGTTYRKLYFSILKNIICVSSNDNLKVFDFMVKGISSLLNYGYVVEARMIFDKALMYISELNEEEKSDFYFVLSGFYIHFDETSNIVEFIDKNLFIYDGATKYINSILINQNLNHTEKITACFPYLTLFSNFLIKYIDLISSNINKQNEQEVKQVAEKMFSEIYIFMYNLFPDFTMPLTQGKKNIVLDTAIPFDANKEYQKMMYQIVYTRLFYLTAYQIEPLVCVSFKETDNLFSNYFGTNSYLYLKFLYAYYCANKRFCNSAELKNLISQTNELGEKIKNIYLENGYEYFNLRLIEEIVQEFNLPHSSVDTLEEE